MFPSSTTEPEMVMTFTQSNLLVDQITVGIAVHHLDHCLEFIEFTSAAVVLMAFHTPTSQVEKGNM